MAEGTTITAASAPPTDELVDLDLPDGMSLDEVAVAEPDTEPDKPEPAAAPAAPATAAASPAPAGADKPEKKGDLGKALKAERDKSKRLATENARLRKNTWEEIETERKQGMARPGAPVAPTATTLPRAADDRFKIDRQRVLAHVDQSEAQAKPLSAHIGPVLDETERLVREGFAESQRLAQDAHTKAVTEIGAYHVRAQQAELREDLAEEGIDYDETLRKAGIWDALQQDAQGNFRDPVVAKSVYNSANPAKKAYRLAKDKLEFLRDPKGTKETDEEPEAPVARAAAAAPVPAPAAPAAPTAPDAVAEARRQGARETAEVVTQNSQRPRGLKVLQRAGEPPKIGLTADTWDWVDKALDSPSEATREHMLSILERNPRLNEFWMSGRPKP